MPSVLIPMALYGHDPTEVSIPYSIFKSANFTTTFATESGVAPQCDTMMLQGATGALLGADAAAKKAHANLEKEQCFQNPISWSDPSFSMDAYDCVFLPGGHEKSVRGLIDSEIIQRELASFFPKTKRESEEKKVLGAICHGVQVLAFTASPNSPTPKIPISATGAIESGKEFKSIIHSCKTTALPSFMESSIFTATRLFLGDYYKTYGNGTPNVEVYVKLGLDDAEKQFMTGPSWYTGAMGKPFIVEDSNYRYLSGRFPPDAEALAKRVVEVVREATGTYRIE